MHHTVKYQDKITHPKLLILKLSIHFSMVYEHLEKLTILFYFIYLMIQAMKGVDNIPHPISTCHETYNHRIMGHNDSWIVIQTMMDSDT